MTTNTPAGGASEGRKAACSTFAEQTKLLMSLASGFILAPPVVTSFLKLQITWHVVTAEVLFVLSVLASYVVLGALAGTQYKGEFNVYRPAVMVTGWAQLLSYVVGLALFGWWFFKASGL